MPVIKNVIYVDGRRASEPSSLDLTLEALRDTGGVAWIALHDPQAEELQTLAEEFSLHRLAVEDALTGHQRSKLDSYDDVLFLVLRPARLGDDEFEIEFGELHLFIGPDFVISLRHDGFPNLASVRARMERHPDELGLGPLAIAYAIVDQVVDEYGLIIHRLDETIEDAEDDLFSNEHDVSVRIYELMRDVVALQHAVQPINGIVDELSAVSQSDPHGEELQAHLRDVGDHGLRMLGNLSTFRELLASALQLHIALVGQQQSIEMNRLAQEAFRSGEQAKKISAWAAILFTPTVIAGIYGMNFVRMPELDWNFGYPLAISTMLVAGVVLYLAFKRNDWL